MATTPLSLSTYGDWRERKYAALYLTTQFPEYEIYWQRFVVPLTQRPVCITFRGRPELAHIGKDDRDVYLAQLHYLVMRHLSRTFDLLDPRCSYDNLVEALMRLVAAQDTAYTFLHGSHVRSTDDLRNPDHALSAWRKWKQQEFTRLGHEPLHIVRQYRNDLVHGRLFGHPLHGEERVIAFHIYQLYSEAARFFKATPTGAALRAFYLDWRASCAPNDLDIPEQLQTLQSTDYEALIALDDSHFVKPVEIIERCWSETLAYLREQWAGLLRLA